MLIAQIVSLIRKLVTVFKTGNPAKITGAIVGLIRGAIDGILF